MDNRQHFYIDGQWVLPVSAETMPVVNPATEQAFATISLGSADDVDLAVAAATRAFQTYSIMPLADRLDLLRAFEAIYIRRQAEMAEAISAEMGAPITWAREAQAPAGLDHITQTIRAALSFEFDSTSNETFVTREPIGVCGLITPWNWPANQITAKLAPALATGCTVVLKPSEIAPISALLIAEMVHEAGYPAGVFNLVNGTGPIVGTAMSGHPDLAMISFTGSTAAGILVAQNAAATVKRVSQELGGKSPNILIDDSEFAVAVAHGARRCFNNSGQTCTAPTRMLVPHHRMDEAADIAAEVANAMILGDPTSPLSEMGPLSSADQYRKVTRMIATGLAEGARLVAGGADRPATLPKGYYVRPTVFSHVLPSMIIAKEEIFGPVLSILGYADEDDAVGIANDSPYGLSSAISCADSNRALRLARRLRAGLVHVNRAPLDPAAPFGGYKHSGNGREQGSVGLEEYLETKSIFGVTSTES